MAKTVDFIFDFASPNAYLASKVLPGVAARTGAKINLVPCLLGGVFKLTGNQSPVAAYANVKNKLAYEFLEIERFAKKHGLRRFKMNPHFPVNTLSLMRGLVAARKSGAGEAYFDAVLAAMWEEEKNMNDPAIVADVVAGGGVDADAIFALAASADVKAELKDNTANAVDRGAFGAPTFFVGDEMYFGKDRLAQVEEALAGA